MAMATVERLEREAIRKTIEDAREALGLDYADLASALDVDRRTLLRYRKGSAAPSSRVRKRLELLREIVHLHHEVFETTEAGLNWLQRPVPLLRERCPIDLMRLGELDKVLSILGGLHSGAFT